jgi:hypothetical protein
MPTDAKSRFDDSTVAAQRFLSRAKPMIVVMNNGGGSAAFAGGGRSGRGAAAVMGKRTGTNAPAAAIAETNQPERGGFDRGGMQTQMIALAGPAEFNRQVRVAFVSSGSVEGGASNLKSCHDTLTASGITNLSYYISPGTALEWQTWRRSLREFAPILFQN